MLSAKTAYGIQVLEQLDRARSEGRNVSYLVLIQKCGFNGRILSVTLAALRKRGWVEHDQNKMWLQREVDLASISLYELTMVVEGSLRIGYSGNDGWPEKNRHRSSRAVRYNRVIAGRFRRLLEQIPVSALVTPHDKNDVWPGAARAAKLAANR